MLEPTPASRPLDENASHRFGGGSEEMALALPGLIVADETHIRFVHQICGLQALARRFMRQATLRQASQLLVNQRQQLVCGVCFASVGTFQNTRDLIHDQTSESSVGELPRLADRFPSMSTSAA